MKLTVLGAYGPFPAPGGACTGFLLENERHRILLDCGNGVISRLQKYVNPWELDAIVISHLHSDHISDLFILRYALDMAGNKGLLSRSMDVYAPEEPAEEYARIPYKNVYNVIPLKADQIIEAGSFQISFLPTIHPLPCLAMKIKSGDKSLVYSGDTEYFPELIQFASGCDLFLCEANFQNEDMKVPRKNHLSAFEAGTIAAKAKVRKLLLTHLPPGGDISISLKEAKEAFADTETAVEDKTYFI